MTTTKNVRVIATPTPAEAARDYITHIRRTGLADRSQDRYARGAAAFLEWVAAHAPEYDDALCDPHVRDYAVRDYRRELKTVRKLADSTVELAMSAIFNFYEHLGMGKPNVRRDNPKQPGGPKALSENDLRNVLRACERRGARDFAMGSLLFQTAVRVSELSALDVDDVLITERQGILEVRYGKGGKSRQVPVPNEARRALRPWLDERREKFGHRDNPALFLGRSGERLSTRSIQRAIEGAGKLAGVKVTPHALRHTYGRRWMEKGGDLVALQQVLGHANVQTTAGYARPTSDFLAAHAETIGVEL